MSSNRSFAPTRPNWRYGKKPVIDASQFSAASVFRARPDVAGRMRQAHRAVTDLKGLVPAGEAPVPMEAMLISDRIAQADAPGAIWHDADEVFKDLEARTAR